MATTSQPLGQDILSVQFEEIRSIWAELLLLMGQSVKEDPTQNAESIDQSVERLMNETESKMSTFRRALDSIGGLSALAEPLREQVRRFGQELEQGLMVMSQQVQQRTQALTAQRDEIRLKLQGVQKKQKGAKGYKPAMQKTSHLFDSQV